MYSITIMMGRMVENPELRHTANDAALCSFRIAVDRPYKVDGKIPADFFTVIAWRGQAELVCKYFKKGKPIVIQGHFENRSYTAKDGSKRYTTELISERISFAGDRADSAKPPIPDSPPERITQKGTNYYDSSEGFEEIPSDDDLPF